MAHSASPLAGARHQSSSHRCRGRQRLSTLGSGQPEPDRTPEPSAPVLAAHHATASARAGRLLPLLERLTDGNGFGPELDLLTSTRLVELSTLVVGDISCACGACSRPPSGASQALHMEAQASLAASISRIPCLRLPDVCMSCYSYRLQRSPVLGLQGSASLAVGPRLVMCQRMERCGILRDLCFLHRACSKAARMVAAGARLNSVIRAWIACTA